MFPAAVIPLTVLTWNIWFDVFAYDIRMNMIFNIIQQRSPDVICLQEVLPKFIFMLKEQSWFVEYDISDDGFGNSVNPYGVLVLAKKHLVAKFSVHELPSNMDRKLLAVEFNKFGSNIMVGAVHLESLQNPKIREQQLPMANDVLSGYDNAILCGDFNFCSYRNYHPEGELENNCLPRVLPSYRDTWSELHPDEKGYTFDSYLNLNIAQTEVMRYDRMMYKSSPINGLRADIITIEGQLSAAPSNTSDTVLLADVAPQAVVDSFSTPPRKKRPLSKRGRHRTEFTALELKEIYPSDHFGLMATFSKCS